MAESESKFWTFLKGVGGVAGVVIGGVLVYHLTVPKTYPTVDVTGVISDAGTNQPISDAEVTVSAGGDIEIGKTDNEGRYLFKLAGTDRGPHAVTLEVQAHGYRTYTAPALAVSSDQPNYWGADLASTRPPGVVPAPAPGFPGVHAGTVFRPQLIHVAPPNFVMPAVTKKSN